MMILKNHEDLLGLGATAVRYEKSKPVLLNLIGLTFILALLGNLSGHYEVYDQKKEQAEKLAASEAAAAESEKNRARDAKLKGFHDLGLRYTNELEQARKKVLGTIQNLESYRDENTQVKKFLAEYQLPEDVNMAIREPVDLTNARSADTFEFQVQHVAEPQNLKQARAKWQALLTAAGRYAAGIDRNDLYFRGYLREANIEEQFKAEFGKHPMQQQAPAVAQPQAEAAPVTLAEPIVEQVVAESPAPVAEVKAAPAPKPAARPAAAPKPKTVPVGGGRVQVTDW